MIVLAIDTCFNRCAACLYDSAAGIMLAEEAQIMERGHAEALAPLVQRVIKNQRLDRIAVTTGPGTFTGLRIGLSFARALGLAKSIPVIGLDTLHAVALTHRGVTVAHHAGKSGFVYVLRADASADIELLKHEDMDQTELRGTAAASGDLPNLAALARFAAAQPLPAHMPSPVYLREADAKPQAAPGMTRAAALEDLPQLAALHSASFPHGWNVADMESMLVIPGTQAFVVELADKVIGMVIVRAIAGEAEILTICVAPAFRHKGIGRKLMQAVAVLPFDKIFLEVAHTNEAARALYKAHGFVETGLRKAYYSDGADAVLMTRALT
ncbi:tRNA (adenosine(37)-N6)-threonylcarbamoyltransferase complex dimerization subunit type 1 TsaB [Aestuariivirga litoralis]|uniref:tRNA (adenosine(37)-N6)-threonylcarbamoyltransferase complex dimerization subunit type 1 TsaB n=1 Tax=Aestuariivirga litoralis TaxID=2650924 RepID=UPI0018C559BE|nr:tRNA (adenosine(37)-N6)-threonylcarbamoyltransferase complex dimerization subunit type 1 TsaB [Aestuariivirga litoralis]MBG1233808.1 tRNA (adenosine(37)-N6)-threonylcarbamoyltransferase complex dimerization subunit type 1 TsaB [Aestuariivirga litoralis]